MKTLEAIGNYLSLVFQNAAWPNVGDVSGLQPAGTEGNLYLSLHTDYPGTGGSQNSSEAAYGSYGRKAVARSSAEWSIVSPQVSNINEQDFTACTSGTETETHWGVGTDASGSGHLLYAGPLTDKILSFVAETTNDITVPGSSFIVNDRVAFYAGVPDDSFPADLTQGQLYFVLTASGEVITVSTTSGGSVVAINTSGSGVCAKVTPLDVSTGVQPTILAGTLVILES